MARMMVLAMIVAAPSTCVLEKAGPALSIASSTTDTAADAGVACGPGTTQAGNLCLPGDAPADPLVGSWTAASGAPCDFFPNQVWNQACLGFDGWAAGWDRIGVDRYVLRSTYRNCWARTTFSADVRAVHIDLDCAPSSWGVRDKRSVDLTRYDLF